MRTELEELRNFKINAEAELFSNLGIISKTKNYKLLRKYFEGWGIEAQAGEWSLEIEIKNIDWNFGACIKIRNCLIAKKIFNLDRNTTAFEAKAYEQQEMQKLYKKIEELERKLAEEKFCNQKLRLEFSDVLRSHLANKKSSSRVLDEEEFSFTKKLLLKHQKEIDKMKEVNINVQLLNFQRRLNPSKISNRNKESK